jgi:hypothetical protein
LFIEVLGKFGRLFVTSKCLFVFITPCLKISSSLTYIGFLAIGTREFVDARTCVFVCFLTYMC